PRGKGVMPDWKLPFQAIPIGKGRKLCDGEEIAILSFGHIGNEASKAIVNLREDGIHLAHYDLRFAKPLDTQLLQQVFTKYKKVITVEDGCLPGGIGAAVLEFMADNQYHAEVIRLGIPDEIIEHGDQSELWKICGIDAEGIEVTARKLTKGMKTETLVG